MTQCDNAGMNFRYLMKNPTFKSILLERDKRIDVITRQRDECKKERDDIKEKFEAKMKKPYEFKVTPPNQKIIELLPAGLAELNRRVAIPVTPEDLFFKLEDIAFRPYEYTELFIRELTVKEDLQLEIDFNPSQRTCEDGKSILK